jgi:hypothetical protein
MKIQYQLFTFLAHQYKHHGITYPSAYALPAEWASRIYLFIYLFYLYCLVYLTTVSTHNTTPNDKNEEDILVRRSGSGLITKLFRFRQQRLATTTRKTSIRTAGVLANGRTDHLPNTDRRRHRMGQSLGSVCPTLYTNQLSMNLWISLDIPFYSTQTPSSHAYVEHCQHHCMLVKPSCVTTILISPYQLFSCYWRIKWQLHAYLI